ncbi:fasciclin domain-containing protein [Zobellia uliginosa]|uniref:fasciclin domain-containing protein n=1 Tax=Zobellia uliginosa TaxID=143224 RepID=UPI0026E19428|nr:fasciclin domain-containing protein [Zobellia uliginosa]MDO6517027.1 fasciclin domain-containing protein [Zobellia uliginosa]
MKYPTILVCLFFSVCFSLSAQEATTAKKPLVGSSGESIVNSTANSKNHQTLLAVMRATDLEELLDQSGPFTVFAPSDRAFENLSGKSVKDLLDPKNKKELKDLLTYHIVAGYISASKILKAMCRGKGKATFTTVQGDTITATMKGIDIILTDSFGNKATIVVADSNQKNGVIHEIDSVILPGKI